MLSGLRRGSNGSVGTTNEEATETVAADTYLPDSQDAQQIESMLGALAPLPDANAVRAFLASGARDHLRVSITQYHVTRSGLRKHTVYTVATQVCPTGGANSGADAPPRPATVERDMADFTALFKGLELRFKGVFLPPLPAANSFLTGSPSEDSLKQQAASLEFALSVVARSPFLSSHRIFREFATSTGAFDKKHASSAAAAAKETSRAEMAVLMWHGALRLLNPPKNRTFARSIALLEVQEQLKHYNAMQSAVHDHLKAASAFTSSSRALSEALSEAALAEGAQRESAVSSVYYDAGPNHSDNDNSGTGGTGVHLEARDVLTQARKAAAQQCEVDAVQETRLREKLLQPLLGEIAYAKQLVRELTALGTLVNKHQKAVLAFDKAQTSPEAVAEALDDAGSPAVSSPLREKALVLQRDANIQVCALLVLEMSRWRSERTVRLAGMMQALAAMRVTLARKTAPMWVGVRKSLPLWVPPTAELVLFAGANVDATESSTASAAPVVVSGDPLHAPGGSIPFAITAGDDDDDDAADGVGGAPQPTSTHSSSNPHNGDNAGVTNDENTANGNVIRSSLSSSNHGEGEEAVDGSKVLPEGDDAISVAKVDDDDAADGVDGAHEITSKSSSNNLHDSDNGGNTNDDDNTANDNVIKSSSSNHSEGEEGEAVNQEQPTGEEKDVLEQEEEGQGSQVLADGSDEEDGISVALDFKAVNTDEMDLCVGDSIARVEPAPDAEWVVVHKTDGSSGLVPKSHLKGLDTPTNHNSDAGAAAGGVGGVDGNGSGDSCEAAAAVAAAVPPLDDSDSDNDLFQHNDH